MLQQPPRPGGRVKEEQLTNPYHPHCRGVMSPRFVGFVSVPSEGIVDLMGEFVVGEEEGEVCETAVGGGGGGVGIAVRETEGG